MNLEGIAQIKNLNLRRENEGESGGRLGSDLKLSVRAESKLLPELLGDPRVASGLIMAIWDDKGAVRAQQVASIHLLSTFRRHNVHLDAQILRCVTLDSFSIVPEADRVLGLTFRVKLTPEAKDLSGLADALVDGAVNLKIMPESEDLPFGELDGQGGERADV